MVTLIHIEIERRRWLAPTPAFSWWKCGIWIFEGWSFEKNIEN